MKHVFFLPIIIIYLTFLNCKNNALDQNTFAQKLVSEACVKSESATNPKEAFSQAINEMVADELHKQNKRYISELFDPNTQSLQVAKEFKELVRRIANDKCPHTR